MKDNNKCSIKFYKNFVIVYLNNKIILKLFLLNSNKTYTLMYIFTILIKVGLIKR
jgi:hypothetical protein